MFTIGLGLNPHPIAPSALCLRTSAFFNDTKQDLYFSIVSLWEIAIKINIGKLQIHRPIEDLSKELQYLNIQILPIIDKDIESYSKLTFPSNHRDPFDRMLIVQATNLSLVLISRDVKFDAYSIQRLWN